MSRKPTNEECLRLAKKDIKFILECMRLGKYEYEQKSFKHMYNPDGSVNKEYIDKIRNPILKKYDDIMNRLKENI